MRWSRPGSGRQRGRGSAGRTRAELTAAYDPAAVAADVYPPIGVRDGAAGLDDLPHHFDRPTAFYSAAAAAGGRVIVTAG